MRRAKITSLALATSDGRPAAPAALTARQRILWGEIVASVPAAWFTSAMTPLVKLLVGHAETAEEIQQALDSIDPDDLLDRPDRQRFFAQLLQLRRAESNMVLTLSTRLRLTPQSRFSAAAAGTATRSFTPQAPAQENVFARLKAKRSTGSTKQK